MKNKIRSRNGWEFNPKTDGFATTGDSMTVPDDSYTVQEILERFTRGIPLDTKQGYYPEEGEDHDDIDLEKFDQLDISEKQEVLDKMIEEIAEARRKREAAKTPAENTGDLPPKDDQKS